MGGPRGSRFTAAAVALAVLAAGCTGDEPEGPEARTGPGDVAERATETADPQAPTSDQSEPAPPPVTEVTATASGAGFDLEWAPVEGATDYRIGADGMLVDVPAALCSTQCRVSVGVERVPVGTSLTLQSVGATGSASEPTRATVFGTPDTTPAEPAPAPEELVLVSQATPPTVEIVPFDSPEEAQQLIADALLDPALAGAGLNLRAQFLDRQSGKAAVRWGTGAQTGRAVTAAADHVRGTWQEQALEFERLPGEPRGQDVVVAVIDDGVEADHPALAGAVLEGTHLAKDGESGTSAAGSHGTAVASLIVGQDGGAVPGIAPGARILPVDVTDDPDGAETGTIAEGIIWAVDHEADIINISMGSRCQSLGPIEFCPEGFEAAVDYAESKGVFVVAGAGNNGGGAEKCDDPADEKVWPAVLGSVISVGGHNAVGQTWECSPNRTDVDILLPSTDLLVAQRDGAYEVGEGTSYASPLMAGLLAVLLAERPDLTPGQVRAMVPQWQSANGTVNVTAVLCLLEFIDCAGPVIEVPDVDWYYPYRATFRFSGDHPVNAAMPLVEGYDLAASPESWSSTSIGQGSAEFGEISGAVYGMKDGTVQATGVMTYSTATSWFDTSTSMAGDILYDLGPLHGHHLVCPWGLPEGPRPVTVFGWQVPVVVDAELVSEAGAAAPEVDLSFSMGVGATSTTAGELPPISFAHDTVDRCGAALAYEDSMAGDPFDQMNYTSLGQVLDRHRDYLVTMEAITKDFVAASPMSLSDPLVIRPSGGASTSGTGVEQDPRISVTIEHTPAGTWSDEESSWR